MAKQPSNWKKACELFRSVIWYRIRKTIKLIITGDFRSLKRRIKKLLKNSEAITPTLYDLADSMNLFYKNEPHFPPLNQEIDIIIPVYNGFEFLPNLFKSIKSNTTSPYRLIIVDDCSTDQRVKPLLEQIAQDHPKTVLLHNTENRGFVSSVNSALKYVQNHFVILNTDVEVPPYWLERLMRPILEDPNIASTTPFSNAATICSFPEIGKDHEIFAGLTVDQVDRLFRYVKSDTISIEIPTAIGYCMGFNYNVVKKIGLFDEETFGKGYGEENDWCFRAKAAGYRHVMVPNLFVYHKHGGSFEHTTKIRLMQKNLTKLLQRYPDYLKQVNDFVKRDPAAPLRHFLVLALSACYAGVKPILIIDHEIGGGANIYRSQLIRERLGIGQPVLLLTYSRHIKYLKLQCLYKEHEVTFVVSNVNHIKTLTEYIELGEIFYNNLVSFKNPLDVVALMVELKRLTGVPLTIAIHDFFPLCPSYNLLNNNGVFCNLPELEECRKCLPRNTFAKFAARASISIDRWREEWSSVFSISNKILCFSESSRALVSRIYPHSSEKTAVQPHTVKDFFTKRPKLDFSGGLNIGIVGHIVYHKGSKIIIEMAKLIEEKKIPARITVIGALDSALVPRNITVTGHYKLPELPYLLERYNVNICFVSSICPETFSFVTSELMQLNMPICCFDLGAPAERVRNYELGYIISEINPATALKEILAFFDKLVIKTMPKK